MIIKIIASILFSYYFVNIAGIPAKIKKIYDMRPHQRLKPFDCVTCLSAWVGLVLFFAPDVVSNCMLVMFASGYIGSKLK